MEKLKMNADEITVQKNIVFSYPIHTHTYCEMTLYSPFDGNISVNNRTISTDNITAILVFPSDFHKIEVKNSNNAKYIKISFDENYLIKGNNPHASLKIDNIGKDSFLSSLFLEAYEHRNEKLYLQMLINSIVFRIARDGEQITVVPAKSRCKSVEKAVKIINEYFCSNITLQSVAKDIYITPQYLSHIFKEETGMCFSEYVAYMRLERAAAMLAETADSVTEICFSCGYRNLSHFLRKFKKEYGFSPNSYRNNILSRSDKNDV